MMFNKLRPIRANILKTENSKKDMRSSPRLDHVYSHTILMISKKSQSTNFVFIFTKIRNTFFSNLPLEQVRHRPYYPPFSQPEIPKRAYPLCSTLQEQFLKSTKSYRRVRIFAITSRPRVIAQPNDFAFIRTDLRKELRSFAEASIKPRAANLMVLKLRFSAKKFQKITIVWI